ncbi:unnamed protein product [Arabidopsis halleri]
MINIFIYRRVGVYFVDEKYSISNITPFFGKLCNS